MASVCLVTLAYLPSIIIMSRNYLLVSVSDAKLVYCRYPILNRRSPSR